MAKEATVSEVIQEGRGFMDQLERGMKEKGNCPYSLTRKWCFLICNINIIHIKHVLLKCAEILVYIYSFSLLLTLTEIFHFSVSCVS